MKNIPHMLQVGKIGMVGLLLASEPRCRPWSKFQLWYSGGFGMSGVAAAKMKLTGTAEAP